MGSLWEAGSTWYGMRDPEGTLKFLDEKEGE